MDFRRIPLPEQWLIGHYVRFRPQAFDAQSPFFLGQRSHRHHRDAVEPHAHRGVVRAGRFAATPRPEKNHNDIKKKARNEQGFVNFPFKDHAGPESQPIRVTAH